MAFPTVLYGYPGDEKSASTAAINGVPIGQKMVVDEREFRLAKLGAAAAVAGGLYEGPPLAVADTMLSYGMVISATVAVGATSLIVKTSGTTAFTADMFKDGYLCIASSTGTGIGYAYKIKANNSAASGTANCTVTLYETDPIKVALAGATTKVALVENQYNGAILTTANTIMGSKILGVACATAAASAYIWLQSKGPAAVQTGATALVAGHPVTCSTVTAGVVGPAPIANTTLLTNGKQLTVIGYGLTEAAATGYAMVNLTLD